MTAGPNDLARVSEVLNVTDTVQVTAQLSPYADDTLVGPQR